MQVWQVRTIISVININWNGFHSLSNIFIPSAKKNNFLANFGKLWQTPFFGKLWQTLFLANSKKKVIFCQSLPKFAKNNFLANFGKFWQTLANFGKHFFWQTQNKVIFCQSLPYLPPCGIRNKPIIEIFI